MKRTAIALAILIFMSALCVFSLGKFEKAVFEMINHASDMAAAVKTADRTAASAALSDLDASWQRHQNLFHILSGGESCEQLDRSLAQVKVWFEQKEKSPETLSELYNLIKEAEDLRKTQSPSVINLF